jgi:hypothetical protein
MSTILDTETQLDDGTMSEWPPLAHIHDKREGKLKEGKLALCGAKLMGLDLPDAVKVCEKCIEIAKRAA